MHANCLSHSAECALSTDCRTSAECARTTRFTQTKRFSVTMLNEWNCARTDCWIQFNRDCQGVNTVCAQSILVCAFDAIKNSQRIFVDETTTTWREIQCSNHRTKYPHWLRTLRYCTYRRTNDNSLFWCMSVCELVCVHICGVRLYAFFHNKTDNINKLISNLWTKRWAYMLLMVPVKVLFEYKENTKKKKKYIFVRSAVRWLLHQGLLLDFMFFF